MHKEAAITVLGLTMSIATMSFASEVDDQLMHFLREDNGTFAAMLSIRDVDSLRKYYDSLPDADIAVQVVYCSRYLAARADSSVEVRLLGTIPDSRLESSYLYRLTYAPLGEKRLDSILNSIYYRYFELITRALLRHRAFARNYFVFASLLEGESAEAIESWPSFMLEQDCVWFFRELSKMNTKVEQRILVYLRNSGFDAECIRVHSSEIPSKYLQLLDSK